MRYPRFIVIVGSFFAMLTGAWAYGKETPDAAAVFRLCQGYVESVDVQRESEVVRVYIKLAAHASEEFAAVTEMHVGKRMVVTAGETVVSRAIVRVRIDSGVLVSGPLEEDAAEQLVGVLKESLPESPCGMVNASLQPTAGRYAAFLG